MKGGHYKRLVLCEQRKQMSKRWRKRIVWWGGQVWRGWSRCEGGYGWYFKQQLSRLEPT